MIVNYGSSRIAKKYAAEYGRSIYCFPLDADPFYMTKEKEKLFERLLEQKGGGSEAEKCTKYWNCRKYLRRGVTHLSIALANYAASGLG